jgi:hypothetical protein
VLADQDLPHSAADELVLLGGDLELVVAADDA